MAERAVATTRESEPRHTCSNSCKHNTGFNSSGPTVDKILQLQRTAGNQAVQKLIKSGVLQAKLKIGQPNDVYEQEADRVAEQVMRMPEIKVQRQNEEEEAIKTKQLVHRFQNKFLIYWEIRDRWIYQKVNFCESTLESQY